MQISLSGFIWRHQLSNSIICFLVALDLIFARKGPWKLTVNLNFNQWAGNGFSCENNSICWPGLNMMWPNKHNDNVGFRIITKVILTTPTTTAWLVLCLVIHSVVLHGTEVSVWQTIWPRLCLWTFPPSQTQRPKAHLTEQRLSSTDWHAPFLCKAFNENMNSVVVAL